ncbi:MAG: hypothetical protein Kow0068_08170 [Marinilabiliales bacterium]
MYKIREEILPLNFFILGIFLLLLGSISIFINLTFLAFNIFMILAGLFLISVRIGRMIDFEQKKLIKYWRILFKRFEKPITLKDVKYISIVPVRLQEHFASKACSYNTIEIQYKLNFVIDKKHYIPFCTAKKETACKHAFNIAKGLEIKILDMSQGKKTWINT